MAKSSVNIAAIHRGILIILFRHCIKNRNLGERFIGVSGATSITCKCSILFTTHLATARMLTEKEQLSVIRNDVLKAICVQLMRDQYLKLNSTAFGNLENKIILPTICYVLKCR